jgi:type 1 glutamine amidotransferase
MPDRVLLSRIGGRIAANPGNFIVQMKPGNSELRNGIQAGYSVNSAAISGKYSQHDPDNEMLICRRAAKHAAG